MEILFSYIGGLCNRNEPTIPLFKTVVQAFESKVLLTQKYYHIINLNSTRSVQFIVFYFCSFNSDYCFFFIQRLLDYITNESSTILLRRNCIAYLASFISRAKFLSNKVIFKSIKAIFRYLEPFLKDKNKKADAILFYLGFQALLYILCYRIKQLMKNRKGYSRLQRFPWNLLNQSVYEPFKVILASN